MITSMMTFSPIPKIYYSFFSSSLKDEIEKRLRSVELFDAALSSLSDLMLKLFAFSHLSAPPYFNFNGKGSAIIFQRDLCTPKKNGFSIILDFRMRKTQKKNFSNLLKNQFSNENFSIQIKQTLILKEDYCKSKIPEKKGIIEEDKHKNRVELINFMNVKRGIMQIFLEDKNGDELDYGCLKIVLMLEKKYQEINYDFNFEVENWYFLVLNFNYQESKVKIYFFALANHYFL
jgi:hypothetical protein